MPRIVSHADWIAARTKFLAKEKELTRLRDELSRERREMPWERVEKDYEFAGLHGKRSPSGLFDGKSQLLLWHFMYGPEWKEGCPSCSFWADNYDGIVVHLRHRDANLVAVSRAPLEQLEAYQKRMGWTFDWYSSLGSDFNFDFGVSFTPEQLESGTGTYNYAPLRSKHEELPGLSVFFKDGDGTVFHTYSAYSRGLDMLNGAYHQMDVLPKGRDEDGLPYTMAWLRRHDRYED